MALTSGIVLFAVVWFMVLFVVLPLRLTTQGDAGRIEPGTHAGAPQDLKLRRKLLVTTAASILIWIVLFLVITSGVISVRDIDWFHRMSPPADGRGG